MLRFLSTVVNSGVSDSASSGGSTPSNKVTTDIKLNIDMPSLWLGIFIGIIAVLLIIGLKYFIKTMFFNKEEINNKNDEE